MDIHTYVATKVEAYIHSYQMYNVYLGGTFAMVNRLKHFLLSHGVAFKNLLEKSKEFEQLIVKELDTTLVTYSVKYLV